jgi:DNA polymerase-3 subunit alpha
MYLNTHSYYSFKYGTMKPTELLEEAKVNGLITMALTDVNSTAGCMSFIRKAPEYQIKPIVGIDFRNGAQPLFVGIAKNTAGFKELNAYLSMHLHASQSIAGRAPDFQEAYVVYPFSHYKGQSLRSNEFIGIAVSDLSKFKFSKWRHQLNKLVIMQTVTFRNKRDFNTHRLMRAIANNTLLSKLPKTEEGLPSDTMYSVSDLKHHFQEFPQIIKNTESLLDTCGVCFDFTEPVVSKNLKTYTASHDDDLRLVRKLCKAGITYRYGASRQDIEQRFESELKVIDQKGFLSYFLINWDIVSYARKMNYPYIGRGSGANSLVAYLMRITDVDPLELDLYFERFINLYRKSPPDFDIDFASRDRNAMTTYIFERFEHTALLATYSTFQYRAVIREIGKVFGLPAHEIDLLSDRRNRHIDDMGKLVLKYGALIEGLPSHLSVHAGGILISDKDMHCYTATYLPPKGFATTQFDMIVAEDIGLHKFDILGQRGLSKIQDAVELIEDNHPNAPIIDIHDVKPFFKDEKVKALLREGKAIGCFYVESPAMRMLLKKLRTDTYPGLVAASSVIRPGVAKSGMMREYILRFRHPEKRKEAHPILLQIMPDTFGVMVYQEDVIKVAHHYAGLSLAEADVLRRGMSGKFRSRSEFQQVQVQFFENCIQKGHDAKDTAEIWRQIESFAGYAFSKGHSASYAVESYQSLFLKAYYPLEYTVATINNGGGFYRPELYIHEARMHGGIIEAPCINNSDALTVIRGKVIYLGFYLIKDLEVTILREIMLVRRSEGQFVTLEHFVGKVQVSLDQLILLIRIGAFRFVNRSKKQLLWDAYMLLGHSKKSKPMRELFELETKTYAIPTLYHNEMEDTFDEIELLGFPLISPFFILKNGISITTVMSELKYCIGKVVEILGYLITVKRTSTSNGKEMNFGTFVDLDGHFIDTTHFPQITAKYPFRGKAVYKIIGRVVEEFDFLSIEVTRMYREPYIDDPRYFDVNAGQRHGYNGEDKRPDMRNQLPN